MSQKKPAEAEGSGVFSHFREDFLASIVVFLVALPLCIGIAVAVGVSPARALLTGIIGGIVVGFLPVRRCKSAARRRACLSLSPTCWPKGERVSSPRWAEEKPSPRAKPSPIL